LAQESQTGYYDWYLNGKYALVERNTNYEEKQNDNREIIVSVILNIGKCGGLP